jgi:hypothetical protein
MEIIAGIFATPDDAARATQRLRGIGVSENAITVLTPGGSHREVGRIPTDEGEQPGMGAALGAVAGAATGASAGVPIGAAVATFIVPGIGPIIAAGVLGAAILGAGGAAIGHALEDSMRTGLPKDELFVYEEALRRGRTVVAVQARDENEADVIRTALDAAGAESIDKAREDWWVGLRDEEAQAYRERGGDFEADELTYRRGFEAAMLPFVRGRGFDHALADLRPMYPEICQADAFRCGFERGQAYDADRRPPEERDQAA